MSHEAGSGEGEKRTAQPSELSTEMNHSLTIKVNISIELLRQMQHIRIHIAQLKITNYQ